MGSGVKRVFKGRVRGDGDHEGLSFYGSGRWVTHLPGGSNHLGQIKTLGLLTFCKLLLCVLGCVSSCKFHSGRQRRATDFARDCFLSTAVSEHSLFGGS